MSDMKALNGPLKGKLYAGLPEHTKTIIDYYKTPYEFYAVTYEITAEGWKFVEEVPIPKALSIIKASDGEQA